MKALSTVLVVLLLGLGTALVVLAVRVYRATGNGAAGIYALILTAGVLSGAVALWRNTRPSDP